MKTYDDFPEIVNAGPVPIEPDGKPEVESTMPNGSKVTRVKAVSGMCEQLIDCLTRKTDTMAPNLIWIRHPKRPFVVWMVETDAKVKAHRHIWRYIPHPTNPDASNPLTRKCSGCGKLEYLCGDFVAWKEWPKS